MVVGYKNHGRPPIDHCDEPRLKGVKPTGDWIVRLKMVIETEIRRAARATDLEIRARVVKAFHRDRLRILHKRCNLQRAKQSMALNSHAIQTFLSAWH